MYRPNDILLRKTTEGDTIWISQRLVIELCGVSDEYIHIGRVRYKQSLHKSWLAKLEGKSEFYLGDSGKSWRWGRKNGQYYYDYDRIPNRAPANYRSMLPSKDELIEIVDANNLRGARERDTQLRNILLEAVSNIETSEDTRWISTQSGYQIDIATAREYSKALAWCRMIKNAVSGRKLDLYGVATVAQFYELCANTLVALSIKNLRTNTAKSLRNKIAGMPTDIYEQRNWIISGKYGNNNRQIVGKIDLVDYETGEIYPYDIHQAIMYAAYMNLDGPEKESLKVLYETIYAPLIVDYGYTPVEYRTFCNHLSRFSAKLLNDRSRHGEEHYKKQLLTYIPTEKLSYAHSLFCGDGSGLFAYKYYTNDKKAELRYMNLYAMLVSDVSTGYIAGWAVAPEGFHYETPDMVKEAVRMAVANGGNNTMFEFVSDNHGAFTKESSKDWLKDVFNRVRTIAAHNSQANPAETLFRLFKNSTLRSMKNFVRTSHNASIANRANLDKIDTHKYPTYSEALEQLKERIDMWNNKPRRGCDQTPAELFAINKHPKCEPINQAQIRKIFGTQTQIEVSRMRGFVDVETNGCKLQFEIPNYITTGANALSKATGNKYYAHITVIYDNQGADLYSADGKFIMTCPVVGKASTSHAESTEQHQVNRWHLEQRKRRQMDVVDKHEKNVSDAINLISGWSYTESVKLGGNKETINLEHEVLLGKEISEAYKIQVERNKRRLEKAEARAKLKTQELEISNIKNRHGALLRKRLPEIYK